MRIIFILLFSSLISCKETDIQKSEKAMSTNDSSSNDTTKISSNSIQEDNFWQKMVMKELKDANGAITAVTPVPESWLGATLPNNMKITSGPNQPFMYTNDQNMQYIAQSSGMSLRQYPGVEAVVKQDFIPWGNSQGYQYVKHYELPEVAKPQQWYQEQLYTIGRRENIAHAFGIDYKDKNGKPIFVLVNISVMNMPEQQNWFYSSQQLTVDSDVFEQTKKQVIFSFANIRYNLEPIIGHKTEQRTTPIIDPITADSRVITKDSPTIIVRILRLDHPTAFKTPISRVLSNTDINIVLIFPNAPTTIAKREIPQDEA